MMLPKYKFPEDRSCPKCGTRLPKVTFCASDCWDGPHCGTQIEHLHWKCDCSFEWLTGTAEGKESVEKLSRED